MGLTGTRCCYTSLSQAGNGTGANRSRLSLAAERFLNLISPGVVFKTSAVWDCSLTDRQGSLHTEQGRAQAPVHTGRAAGHALDAHTHARDAHRG